MKICYISDTCFSDCDLELLSILADEHEITYMVVIPQKTNYSAEEISDKLKGTKNAINFIPVNVIGRKRNILNLFLYGKHIFNIRKEVFDVIYIHSFEDIYLALYCKIFGKAGKTVYGVHDAVVHSGWRNNILLKMGRDTGLKKYNKYLTFSEAQKKVLHGQYPGKTIFKIPLAQKNFGEALPKTADDGVVRFLFFGNIATYKGLDILLKAGSELSKRYSNFQIVVAGRCENWESDYQPLISDTLQIDAKIRFIHNDEIPEIFCNVDYHILPYRDVTQSGPLMIAYRYNIPIIASELEGFKEFIIPDVSGYFFERENPESLSRVLEAAILRPRGEYAALQKRMADFVDKNFSLANISEMYDKMFNSVLYDPD